MTSRPRLLRTLRGVAEAPVDRVAEVLMDIGPGGRSPLIPPGIQVTIRVDTAARTVSVQGDWWYRGDVVLTARDNGCLITQQIFNVAQTMPWAVRFVARKPLAASPQAFEAMLRVLGERLDCATYPLMTTGRAVPDL
jgi:hypothetical protein